MDDLVAEVLAFFVPHDPDRQIRIHIVQPGGKGIRVARMAVVLRVLHDALRAFATVLQPFMPTSMAKLLDQLGVPEEARGLAALDTPLPGGQALPPPAPLFAKIEVSA